ncbi:MAG TPA: 2'-5' RNA ligase family protein, partial [Chitinophagaceae bacterium]
MNSLYFVAVIPPQPLCGKITAVKQDFRERFHSSHALRLVPHITLKAPFSFPDEKKPEVLDWFAQLPVPAAAFRQKLSGFDCFRSKRNPVIFIVPELN